MYSVWLNGPDFDKLPLQDKLILTEGKECHYKTVSTELLLKLTPSGLAYVIDTLVDNAYESGYNSRASESDDYGY